MEFYARAAVERSMKIQEVILRAVAKKITWWQAAEIIGVSDRTMKRVEQVLRLYQEKYFDFNVRYFFATLCLGEKFPWR